MHFDWLKLVNINFAKSGSQEMIGKGFPELKVKSWMRSVRNAESETSCFLTRRITDPENSGEGRGVLNCFSRVSIPIFLRKYIAT